MIASVLGAAGAFGAVLWLLGAALVWRHTADGRTPTRDRVLYAVGWPVMLAVLVVMSLRGGS